MTNRDIRPVTPAPKLQVEKIAPDAGDKASQEQAPVKPSAKDVIKQSSVVADKAPETLQDQKTAEPADQPTAPKADAVEALKQAASRTPPDVQRAALTQTPSDAKDPAPQPEISPSQSATLTRRAIEDAIKPPAEPADPKVTDADRKPASQVIAESSVTRADVGKIIDAGKKADDTPGLFEEGDVKTQRTGVPDVMGPNLGAVLGSATQGDVLSAQAGASGINAQDIASARGYTFGPDGSILAGSGAPGDGTGRSSSGPSDPFGLGAGRVTDTGNPLGIDTSSPVDNIRPADKTSLMDGRNESSPGVSGWGAYDPHGNTTTSDDSNHVKMEYYGYSGYVRVVNLENDTITVMSKRTGETWTYTLDQRLIDHTPPLVEVPAEDVPPLPPEVQALLNGMKADFIAREKPPSGSGDVDPHDDPMSGGRVGDAPAVGMKDLLLGGDTREGAGTLGSITPDPDRMRFGLPGNIDPTEDTLMQSGPGLESDPLAGLGQGTLKPLAPSNTASSSENDNDEDDDDDAQ